MSYIVKADTDYHVTYNSEVLPVVRALANKFFIMDTVPADLPNYKVEIPQYVIDGMQFFDFPDGQKQKVGWNPYNTLVSMEVDPTKPSRWFTRYTDAQSAQRLATRKWVASQYVVDGTRLGNIDDLTATLYVTEILSAISNDELNIFFTEKLLYDC
jgi:hypothetical protein